MATLDDQRVRRKPARPHRDLVARQTRDQFGWRDAQPIRSQRQRRRRVVELQPAFGRVEPESVEPPLDEPSRVGERDAEVRDRVLAVNRIVRPLRQRQRVAVARDRSQHRVHQTTGAALSRPSRQLHGIINDGRGRYAGEIEQLVRAQPQDLEHLRIEPIDRALREMRNDMVERGLPALDACRDFGCERPVALVLQSGARVCDRRRQIGAPGGHGQLDVVRRDARGADHGRLLKRLPGATR